MFCVCQCWQVSGSKLSLTFYLFFSFSGERGYDHNLFHGRVYRLNIDDHNVPHLRCEGIVSVRHIRFECT